MKIKLVGESALRHHSLTGEPLRYDGAFMYVEKEVIAMDEVADVALGNIRRKLEEIDAKFAIQRNEDSNL